MNITNENYMSINDASQIAEEAEEGVQGSEEVQEDQEDCPTSTNHV